MRKIIGPKNKIHYVEEKNKLNMVKSKKGWLVLGATIISLGFGVGATTSASASQVDGVWTPRSVQDIKSDMNQSSDKHSYEIKWGDTLSAISTALNVSQERLAQINSIENKDLIYAGNTMHIDGQGKDATITIKDQAGKADKVYNVDPSKPVVNEAKTAELVKQNANAQNTQAPTGNTTQSQSNTATVENGGNGTPAGTTNSNNTTTPAPAPAPAQTDETNTNNSTKPVDNGSTDTPKPNPAPSENKTELDKLKDHFADSNQKMTDLKSKLAQAQSDLETAKTALANAESNNTSDLENQIQAQEAVVKTATDALTLAQNREATGIADELSSKQITLDSLNQNLANFNTDKTAHIAALQAATDALPKAQAEYDATMAQNPDEQQKADAETKLQQAKSDVLNAQSQVDIDATAQQNMEASVAEVKSAMDKLNAEKVELSNKIPALAETVKTETAKLTALQTQLANAKNTNIDALKQAVVEKQQVVDSINTEIASLQKDIDATTKNIADIELKVSRDDASASIDSMSYLTAQQKSDFKSQLASTLTKDSITSIVASASKTNSDAKATADLNAAKKVAIDKINALKFVGDKASFSSNIESATSIDQINAIVAQATTADKAEELKQAKDKAVTTVNQLSNLTDSDKASFVNQIQSADSTKAVATISSTAQTKNDLNRAKTKALASIKSLDTLSDSIKASLSTQVENATVISDVTSIVAKAQQANSDAKALKSKQDSAVAQINKLSNLSSTQKDEFIKAVTSAITIADVKTSVSNATAKDAIIASQSSAISAVNALSQLAQADKDGYITAINNAKSTNDIASIVTKATAQNAVVKDQNTAISQISGLKYLSDSDKASFVNSIKATTDVKQMATIVSNAQKANDNAKSLNDTKADAINATNDFHHISDEDRASAISAINAATTKEAVASELSKLNDKDKAGILKELNQAKDNATSTINGMSHLEADQKAAFVAEVKSASDLSAIDAIVTKATKQDAIEASKATISFEIVDFNGNHVSTVAKRVVEGSYSFTLRDLGISDSNIKVVSGDLTGSVKAQENKSVTIKTVDPSKVQTVNVTAIDEETGNVIKKITLYYNDGDTVFISPSSMGLNPDEWMSPGNPSTSFKANAGVVYDHAINFTVTRPQLSDDQITVANAAFMQLINQHRKDNGLKELIEDSRLDSASAIRAKETSTVFSHMRPDGTGFNTAIYQEGITDLGDNVIGFGENIASTGASNNNGTAAALRLFTMWKNSPGHNANMLDPDFTRMGIGIYATPIGIFASTLFLATYDK